jgi:hypothetical protein
VDHREHCRHVSLLEASLQAPRLQPLSEPPRGLSGPALRGNEALPIEWQEGKLGRRIQRMPPGDRFRSVLPPPTGLAAGSVKRRPSPIRTPPNPEPAETGSRRGCSPSPS